MRSLVAILGALFSLNASTPCPQLFFEYGWCLEVGEEVNIDQELRKKAFESVPYFQAVWDREGTVLLPALCSLLGREFSRHELDATFVLIEMNCHKSNPLMIHMEQFIDGTHGALINAAFVDTVFQLMIFRWTNEFFDWRNSPMVQKYAQVDPHGHLAQLAIARHIYTTLNRQDLLQMLEQKRRKWGLIDKVWRIIDEEGIYVILQDIRDHLR